MSELKRRIVYLSDGEWSKVREVAARHGLTMSGMIRTLIAGSVNSGQPRTIDVAVVPPVHRTEQERAFAEFRPAPKPSQRRK